MKVVDCVKESFFNYPTLYAANTFEDIKFGVLHQYFIVLGNGIEWANTKKKEHGGYLLEPQMVKRNGEWRRTFDLPYGKKTVDLDIEYCVKNPIYDLKKIDHETTKRWMKLGMKKDYISGLSRSEWKEKERRVYTEKDFGDLPPKTLIPGNKYKPTYEYFLQPIEKKPSEDKRNPYPNFQKEYSCFYEPGVEYIKDDWKEAAIEHLKYWQEWFNTEKVKTYHSHPEKNEKTYNELLALLINQVSQGKKLNTVCKNYGFKPFDLHDPAAWQYALKEKWLREEKSIKNFLSKTISKLSK